ncbi:MAG: PEP-CTERM sorting domain-containing protein [Opitutales bacterium]
MHLPSLSLLLGSASLALTSALDAQTISFGSFDSEMPGWTLSLATEDATRDLAVVDGTLAFTPGASNNQWGPRYDMNFLGSANLETVLTAPMVELSFDVTYDWSEWSATGDDWVQVSKVAYNSPSTGFAELSRDDAAPAGLMTDTGNPGFPGGTNVSTGTYTTTLTWDITGILAGANSSDGYHQLDIEVNAAGGVVPGPYYFDNFTFTAVPEPSAMGLLVGLGVMTLVSRRRR